MKHALVAGLTLLFAFTAQFFCSVASADDPSTSRDPLVPWQHMAVRSLNTPRPIPGSVLYEATRPDAKMKPMLEPTTTPYAWKGSRAELQQAFELARDSRVVAWRADFPRRPSWLYPDDGCYARAVVAADTLKRRGLPLPGKIFAFGNLWARSPRSPQGIVSWWYHVAVAYRFENEVYVIDPSVDELKPLTAKEWVTHIGGNNPAEVKVSLCHSRAYFPADNCESGNLMATTSGFQDQMHYLNLEWDRLLELGQDPAKLLGDSPSWQAFY